MKSIIKKIISSILAAALMAAFVYTGVDIFADKYSSLHITDAAEETAAPVETAVPTEKPKEFTDAPEGYFDDALFIGDSRTVGIKEYGGLYNAAFFCSVGMSTYSLWSEGMDVKNAGYTGFEALLQNNTYGKVYIMLGINELGGYIDSIAENYREIVETIREYQPDAIIYVEANLHVTTSRSSYDGTFNNTRLNALNEQIAALANGEDIFYIDVNTIFDDEYGGLNGSYSSDGIHVSALYYEQWGDWIKTQCIVE